MIIRGGETFFLPGGRHGVLLIHGFTGAPSEMLLLGQGLNKIGYTVLCMRLAGHGTTPRDLAHMSADDWYYSACDGYSILSACCDKISVVGQSMGAVLGMLLSINAKAEHCVSLAAPIYIHAEKQLHRLPPREQVRGRFEKKHRRQLADVPEVCNASYGEMPLEAVYEVLDLIDRLKKELSLLKCPQLIVQSNADHTVQPRSADYIYRKSGSCKKELKYLDKSGHLLTLDCERETVFGMIEEFLADR